jgi:hypothetical protein
MGTTVTPMAGGKALQDYPGVSARAGQPSNRLLSGVALLAFGASKVLAAGPLVWSDPRSLLLNGAFWYLVAIGSGGVVLLSSLFGSRSRLKPIQELKRRELWGKGIGAVFMAVVVAEIFPTTSLGLELSIGRVDIHAINDGQLVASAIVLSDVRILNTRQHNVDLTFSADIVSHGEGAGAGEFSAVTDCNITNGTVIGERLEELGLGGARRTPLPIPAESPAEGRLCLWAPGDHPAPFDPDFTLHIRDGVSQEVSSVEMSQAGGSYEAHLIRSSGRGPSRLADRP